MVKTMLDLDVFRDGKTITVPVTMDAYRHFLYGSEDTELNIDLDKGNVESLCFIAEDGFYQPLETDTVFIEFGDGKIQFRVIDVEYNMFELDSSMDTNNIPDSTDDLIHPHALIKFKLHRLGTPLFEYDYNAFNPATKAILDGFRPISYDSPSIHHIAWHSIEPDEYVSSVPGDVLWEPGIPCSFKFTVSEDGTRINLKLVSYTAHFDKKDTHKILATLERVNEFEKSVQISLNDDMCLVAQATKTYPSAVEVSAGSTYSLLNNTHSSLGKVFEFIYYGLEIGAL